MNKFVFHGVIEKAEDRYRAICLELDVATKGRTLEEAKANLKEAVDGYLECADKDFHPDTMKSMIRQSGLTEEEFYQ